MIEEKQILTPSVTATEMPIIHAMPHKIVLSTSTVLIWRRYFNEFLATFLLVLVAAGAKIVGTEYPGSIPLQSTAAIVGLIVFVLIMAFTGAHFNAVVTLGLALRHIFPWRRVPGYLIAQFLGSVIAALFLRLYFGNVANLGSIKPGASVNDSSILIWETMLTFGLITTILAINEHHPGNATVTAFSIAAYFSAAILWAGPIDGPCMNPARQIGPALVSGNFTHLWAYTLGPILGTLLAVSIAYLLHGPHHQSI